MKYNNNNNRQASSSVNSIFYFSAGIGFFIIFLSVQPNAFSFLKNSIKSFFGFEVKDNNDDIYNNDNNSNSFNISFSLKRLSDVQLASLIIDKLLDPYLNPSRYDFC
jgi:hypothetical protein